MSLAFGNLFCVFRTSIESRLQTTYMLVDITSGICDAVCPASNLPDAGPSGVALVTGLRRGIEIIISVHQDELRSIRMNDLGSADAGMDEHCFRVDHLPISQ